MSWQPIQNSVRWLRELVEDALKFVDENIPGGTVGAIALAVVSYFSFRYLASYYHLANNKKKILSRQAKSKERAQALRRRLEKCKKDIDLSITDLSFGELQQKLQKGELTATKVLWAFQWKALQVNDELNCVTDFIDGAEVRASELDKLSPGERGPLHGIPVSLKEVVGVVGHDSTSGICCFIDKLYTENGVMLKVLVHQGAVPFALTNISQAQMSISCSNPIFGETKNPYDHSRTSGGSSGGEGALIGSGASVMGIACDMGGSIRIPSHFCGICGMKPTPNRLSGRGNFPLGHGIITCAEVYGPMGRDVDTLVAMMKALLCKQMWNLDPLLPQLPWRDELYNSTKPLKIGFYICDGGLEPMPAVRRCVLLAKRALEKMGHTVVDFHPPNVLQAMEELFFAALLGDEGQMFTDHMKDDILDPSIKEILTLFRVPLKVRRAASKILSSMHPAEKALLRVKAPKTVNNWWHLNEQIEEFRTNFMQQLKTKGLDGIICPAFPFTAFRRNDDANVNAGFTYTCLYNLLDLPTGIVPTGKVEKRDVEAMKDYPQRNEAEKFMHRTSKGSEGLPIGVQCVSLPFQEEVTLRLMKDLEKGLKL